MKKIYDLHLFNGFVTYVKINEGFDNIYAYFESKAKVSRSELAKSEINELPKFALYDLLKEAVEVLYNYYPESDKYVPAKRIADKALEILKDRD